MSRRRLFDKYFISKERVAECGPFFIHLTLFYKLDLKRKDPQNLSLPPMQFKDIIGQQAVKQNLVELIQHNRLSHALLFIGKEGNGALPLSLAFAQYIVCEGFIEKNNEVQALRYLLLTNAENLLEQFK